MNIKETIECQDYISNTYKLSKDMVPKTPAEVEHMKQVPYRQLVGALMYLAVATRLDIAYAVGVLGRFSSNPGPSH